jgi:hypothetical protein
MRVSATRRGNTFSASSACGFARWLALLRPAPSRQVGAAGRNLDERSAPLRYKILCSPQITLNVVELLKNQVSSIGAE